jgi:hypothetical protein
MKEYRVTKYNPAFRDSTGAYTRDEWISVKDIGRSFAGVVLTREEYDRVERAYVSAALTFLREGGVTSLTVSGLENTQRRRLEFQEGTLLPLDQVGDVIKRVLREEFWCRLQGVDGFVHIGWDFYMYVGVPCPCPEALAQAAELGLYVEEFSSPYNDEG